MEKFIIKTAVYFVLFFVYGWVIRRHYKLKLKKQGECYASFIDKLQADNELFMVSFQATRRTIITAYVNENAKLKRANEILRKRINKMLGIK